MRLFLSAIVAYPASYIADIAFTRGKHLQGIAATGRSMAMRFSLSSRRQMRQLSTIAVLGLLICACSQAEQMPPELKACATKLYANYNPKNLDQCTAVCIACLNGVKTTCSTSCNLNGAR